MSTVQTLIRSEAARHSVPVALALAVAELESRFNPSAEGDKLWHTKQGGALYRKLVHDEPRFAANPARLEPEAWHSYGVFQLLAPYHVQPHEHPRVLLDPKVNISRGVRFLASLLKRAEGDPYAARLAYVGCGFDGGKCSLQTANEVRQRLSSALSKWQGIA